MVFLSAYHPCYNPDKLHTMWSQQTRYFNNHKELEVPDVHVLFIRNLYKFLGNLCDIGHNVVLGMDMNDDV